jgi:hypothetical protein
MKWKIANSLKTKMTIGCSLMNKKLAINYPFIRLAMHKQMIQYLVVEKRTLRVWPKDRIVLG